jgi:hypothetical protein
MVRIALAAALVGALGSTPQLRVLFFGDFGDPTPQQRRVTRAALAWHEQFPFDLAFQPGDNLYNCGPNPTLPGAEACRFGPDGATVDPGYTPAADPLFERNEAPLRALQGSGGGAIPVYLALGNHDVGMEPFCTVPGMTRDEWMRRRACLEVAHRSPTWRLPGRHYVVDEGDVRFIVLDTNVVVADYAGFTLDAEAAFLRAAAAPCATRRCFVVAHFPPAIASGSSPPGPADPWLLRTRGLVAAGDGRIAAVFAGHVHALEHVSYDGVEVLVTGAGARPARYGFAGGSQADVRLHFGSNAGGFGVLEVAAGGWTFRFVDDRGRSLHCCEAAGRGPCVPVACR